MWAGGGRTDGRTCRGQCTLVVGGTWLRGGDVRGHQHPHRAFIELSTSNRREVATGSPVTTSRNSCRRDCKTVAAGEANPPAQRFSPVPASTPRPWRLASLARLAVAMSSSDRSARRHYRDRVSMARQRQDYFDALAWVTQLMTAVQVRHLDARTPCADFDVRSLLGHLLGTAHRGLATALRVPTRDIPHVITDVPDAELGPRYATLATSIRVAWSTLAADSPVVPPWGPCAAVQAVRGFTVETITHGWDLAVATGQPSDAPNGIADRCLSYAAVVIPDRLRGVMYDGPVVAVGNFSTTEQLAHLLGHERDLTRRSSGLP